MMYGGLGAGGTKMVCAIADENGTILDRWSTSTNSPEETIPKLIRYFKRWNIRTLGIGCFGPLNLNEASEKYGCLLKTPKTGWEELNILKPFEDALHIPIGLDTDVNGAVLGEVMYGAAKGCGSAVYVTVGTGIGVGIYLEGKLVHGMLHPEVGHMLVARHPRDSFGGCCSFHRNCLEGFASGPSIEMRWGKQATELHGRNEVWELEAYYLGQAAANLIMCYSPERIIFGGGVMHKPGLLEMIKTEASRQLNGYIRHELLEMENYITSPGCGDNSGILGAIELGKKENKGK